MTCQNCGANVEGNFCPVCGTPRAANAGYQPQQPPYSQQSYSQQPYAPQPVTEPYRPITRKWWFWVLIVVTLIALLITSQMVAPESVSTDNIETVSEAQLPNNEPAQEPAQKAVVPPAKDGVTNPFGAATSGALPSIERTVLMDKDGIRVTATGLTEEEWIGPEISVLIENDTDRAITMQALDVSVNGIMFSPMFYCDVAAGKKSNEKIAFYQTDLDNAGISTIQSVELTLEALDSDNWDSIAKGDMVTIRTDAPEQQQALDKSGTPALNQDGLEIIVRGVKTGDSTWGPEIQLFLQNQTGRDIIVQLDDFSINGFMVSPIFSVNITDGKVAYYSISLSQEELDTNGIDTIESMECSFVVVDPETWDTIVQSDPVTVQMPN